MKHISIYIIMLALFFVYEPGFTQDANKELNAYLEMAAKNNPELKAAYTQYLAALEKVPQVGSLPDPEASFGYFIKPMELLGGRQRANIQLMQMFPWFGTLKAAKDEASMMAGARLEAFNTTKATLFFQVKSGWYQLMKYDSEIALVKENIALLHSLEKLVLVKFQSPDAGVSGAEMTDAGSGENTMAGAANSAGGDMAGANKMQNAPNTMASGNTTSPGMSSGMNSNQTGLQDVLRIRMEILDQEQRLALLYDQRKTGEAELNALLNRDLETPIPAYDALAVQILPINKLAIADSILANNPMLTMLENETVSYAYMEQKAKKMGLPMLGIGLDYMIIQEKEGSPSMMNGKDMVMPMLSVSIPIYRKKYRAMQNEAKLMQEAGNAQAISLKNNLLVQYRQFIQELDDAERRMSLYSEQEDLARRTTGLLLSGYTTTGNDYEEVLRMQMKVLEYGFKRIEAIVDFNTAIAMAEKMMNSVNY